MVETLLNFIGFSVADFTQAPSNLRSGYKTLSEKYTKETPQRLKMLDTLSMLCLSLFAVNVVYGVAVCRDPFNSFIAGTFCTMGIFSLTMSLRVQLASDGNDED